ncbi:NAD(P)/FAD-dependent oxidoreductase [Desulfatitalea tepidiphila]|uniref:NAD(P)/FAD-dependent oxidoreductase n=1 Tax=Desulfatitalea tepidiphila TaxID=1185843 RepID=UPI0006B6698A|nr:FAD-dependent oxidoreductase [Desulfatitalea tepidiphila]
MKIAVIGTGISGLVAAYLLSEAHDISVFEANDYIGGHTHTVEVPSAGGTVAVDTGFIVFNAKTYPNFIRLMERLGVPWQPSNMSFSVQCERTGLIFSPSTFASLFAQRKNLVHPAFYRMLADALRFRSRAAAIMEQGDDRTTLAAYLKREKYSRGFIEHFIVPMGAAIWSADPRRFMDFPARYFITFFHHHGFLNLRDQPEWRTIKGGSSRYIAPLTRPFRDNIYLNTPVRSVQRHSDHIELTTADDTRHRFDQVVIAAHSDQALGMLVDASPEETEILGAIAYQENFTVLHRDVSLMPSLRAAWASWNYRIPRQAMNRVALTYNMNLLQNLPPHDPFCVTLNMAGAIDPAKKIKEIVYHHPIYDPVGLAARKRREEISGVNRTWYCGAYWGYGFHEDGVNSALAVARHFGLDLD